MKYRFNKYSWDTSANSVNSYELDQALQQANNNSKFANILVARPGEEEKKLVIDWQKTWNKNVPRLKKLFPKYNINLLRVDGTFGSKTKEAYDFAKQSIYNESLLRDQSNISLKNELARLCNTYEENIKPMIEATQRPGFSSLQQKMDEFDTQKQILNQLIEKQKTLMSSADTTDIQKVNLLNRIEENLNKLQSFMVRYENKTNIRNLPQLISEIKNSIQPIQQQLTTLSPPQIVRDFPKPGSNYTSQMIKIANKINYKYN